MEFDKPHKMNDIMFHCLNMIDVTNRTASCSTTPNVVVPNNVLMELRVWDNTDLLVAKRNVSVIVPSINHCRKYSDNIFCPHIHPPTCVNNCDDECLGSIYYAANSTLDPYCQKPSAETCMYGDHVGGKLFC